MRLRRDAGAVYLTVEKILDFDEDLPAEWPVAGHHRLRISQLRQRYFLRPRATPAIQPNL